MNSVKVVSLVLKLLRVVVPVDKAASYQNELGSNNNSLTQLEEIVVSARASNHFGKREVILGVIARCAYLGHALR